MPSITTIAYKNLRRKRMRTALTVLGIALSTWVLISLLGFNKGYESSLNTDIDNLGFQVLLTAKGCPYEAATLMMQGGTGLRYLPDSVLDSLRAHPEVQALTPMLMQAVFDPSVGETGAIAAYNGVDRHLSGYEKYLEFAQGGWFKDAEALEAVIGYEAAELEQREVGDILLIPDKEIELKVVGILKRSGTQDDGTIFVPYKALQKACDVEGKLTSVGIKVSKETDVNASKKSSIPCRTCRWCPWPR
jgi:putative ABC transport system permease protein